MKESTNREKVLKHIRTALINKLDDSNRDLNFTSPVFNPLADDQDVVFAQEFSQLGGKFVYCANEKELLLFLKTLSEQDQWRSVYTQDASIRSLCESAELDLLLPEVDITDAEVAVSYCDALVARFGSIMLSSGLKSGRKLVASPDKHVVIGFASQLVPELKDALKLVREKYKGLFPSFVTTVSGPSRTLEIERETVIGAMGPKELYLFYVDDL